MSENIGGPGRPESNEKLKLANVNFFKLGGTWDMVFRDGQKIGSGSLDDDQLLEMQTALGYFSEDPQQTADAERKLVRDLYARFGLMEINGA